LEKITVTINDISITIPKTGKVEDVLIAFMLVAEMYGWHRNTVEEEIINLAQELKDE
jgi:hypothetical protein